MKCCAPTGIILFAFAVLSVLLSACGEGKDEAVVRASPTAPPAPTGGSINTGRPDYGTQQIGVPFDLEVYISPILPWSGQTDPQTGLPFEDGTGMAGYQFDLVYDSSKLKTVAGSDQACPYGMTILAVPPLGEFPYSIACFIMPPEDAGVSGNVLLNTVRFECQDKVTDAAITLANCVAADGGGGDLGAVCGSGAVVSCEG